MTETPSLRDRIDSAIRPAMLIGLQDAELHDEPGRERIGEWADSITAWVLAVVQPALDRLSAELDTITAVARTNAAAHRAAVEECERLRAEITAAQPSSEPDTDPLVILWDRTVIHPGHTGDDTIVCCLTDDGQPVALILDPEHREALGLQLVDPEGE